MPVKAACRMCSDNRRFMHNPRLVRCKCGLYYCQKCLNTLPRVKAGIFKKGVACPGCGSVIT